MRILLSVRVCDVPPMSARPSVVMAATVSVVLHPVLSPPVVRPVGVLLLLRGDGPSAGVFAVAAFAQRVWLLRCYSCQFAGRLLFVDLWWF